MLKWSEVVRKIILRTTIVILGASLVIVGRGLLYYDGFYQPPLTSMPSYEQIITPTRLSTDFSDTYEESEGIILIDLSHDNAFDIKELNALILRLISRGLTIEFFNVEDDLGKELLGEVEKPEEELLGVEDEETKANSPAAAFIVISPQIEFSKEERETVNEFTSNNGKLLLIADPTRWGKMNSLAFDFGLIFEADYLYNMKENDANYRNIFISEFRENDITRNLQKIALHTAGSISSNDGGIAFGDDNTFSSLLETRKRLSPIAITSEYVVLTIHDFHFIIEPNNGILDNNQLISNIADWLVSPAEK